MISNSNRVKVKKKKKKTFSKSPIYSGGWEGDDSEIFKEIQLGKSLSFGLKL